MIRIGSALFNADHGNLAAELRRVEEAGVDFIHWDVFDGRFVPDLAFPPRTIATLRPRTRLPFEVHLAAEEPLRLLPALKEAGADLVFLPAEATPLVYEAIFAARELGLSAGLSLALGTPLGVLEPVLPLLDAVLLLGRVIGEGQRGRDFNRLLLGRVAAVRRMIDDQRLSLDLQAAGGLETDSCVAAVAAGATSLPLGGALHREPDMGAYLGMLRAELGGANQANQANQANRRAQNIEHISQNTEQTTEKPKLGARSAEHGTWNLKLETPNKYRVLIASRSFGPNCPQAVERMREAGCELVPNEWGRAPTEAELLERVGDIDVLISGTEPVTERVLQAAPRLKVISKHGVGYENIDLEAARRHHVPVALAQGAISDAVADMAMALLLSLARRIPESDRAVKAGRWPKMVGLELRGRTLGIVGLGQIGKGLARRARGFGMQVTAYDPFPDERFARSWGVRMLELDELLASADAVSLHVPVTPETRHLFDRNRLGHMKQGALLINTARGELVDETALADALRSGRLAGAASDVFVTEPPGANPLLELDNFVATPHSAGQTDRGLRAMGEITAENALRVLRGEEPLFRIA